MKVASHNLPSQFTKSYTVNTSLQDCGRKLAASTAQMVDSA